MTKTSEKVAVEQAVMVCPQCEGEGSYADGLDEAACSTECTRCGGNGWIVDLARLRTPEPAVAEQGEGEKLPAICYAEAMAMSVEGGGRASDDYVHGVIAGWEKARAILATLQPSGEGA